MDEDLTDSIEEIQTHVQSVDEYDAFLDALGNVEEDSAIQDLMAEQRRIENELRLAHENDEPHETHEELHHELDAVREELNQQELLQEYNQASEALAEELGEVNRAISEELEIDFADFAGGM